LIDKRAVALQAEEAPSLPQCRTEAGGSKPAGWKEKRGVGDPVVCHGIACSRVGNSLFRDRAKEKQTFGTAYVSGHPAVR
jgi:hypothetical protein